MKFFIVLLVVGLVSSKISVALSAEAAAATATDATKNVVAAATGAASGAVDTGKAAVADAVGAATAMAQDPLGSVTSMANKVTGAMNPSQMTGMFKPFLRMTSDLMKNGLDATELGFINGLDIMNENMKTMSETVKSTPLIGGMVSPVMGVGSQMAQVPRQMLSPIFGGTRGLLNSLFGAMGVPKPENNNNSFKPSISTGGFGSLLGGFGSMIPAGVPGLPTAPAAATAPAATAT